MSEKTPRLFINYRISDTGESARALFRELESTLEHGSVFIDIEDIEPGVRWRQKIEDELAAATDMLAMIGKDWTSVTDPETGDRRLIDEDDWVRREIETALARECRVVPVLVENVELPTEKQLERVESLLSIRDLEAVELRGKEWRSDYAKIRTHLEGRGFIFASAPGSQRIALSKLPAGAKKLIGRTKELGQLTRALKNDATHIVEFVAWGGVGKSALVGEWMARLAKKNWPGIERYFDWSFYSQGTKDQSAASADSFIAEALAFFGDDNPQAGSPHDRGSRLAELVARQPTVLILDGIEPLQYGAGPLKGQLKDPALVALLKGLAQRSLTGLCVLTTREALTDLSRFHGKTVSSHPLEHLADEAGAALLHASGATRRGAADIADDNAELKAASREVTGHALTLTMLGGYLKLAHGGDIDRRDRVRFEDADEEVQGGHAFRVIAAYEKWLQAEKPAERGPRMLAILRLLGLFDRPASEDCLTALRHEPAIEGLTDSIVGLSDDDWNIAVTSLVELDLLSSDQGTLDAHPLLREYFASRLRAENREAGMNGHRRIYDHLCRATEYRPDTLAGLQPLFQAVDHGCMAGLYNDACDVVYVDRILRGTEADGFYSCRKLGAVSANLTAVASFFDIAWSQPSRLLSEENRTWLIGEASFYLRSLSRSRESLQLTRAALELRVRQKNWRQAATLADRLSEEELSLGDLASAISDANESIIFADRSGNVHAQILRRAQLARCRYMAGDLLRAGRLFEQAEKLQLEHVKPNPLESLHGFHYCEMLFHQVEVLSWQRALGGASACEISDIKQILNQVEWRARGTLERGQGELSLLDSALSYLTLARSALCRSLFEGVKVESAASRSSLDLYLIRANDGLRDAGSIPNVPLGLLTSAWHSALCGDLEGSEEHLAKSEEVAERGPMPLHQADILLTRSRLFFREDLDAATKDLVEARRLIEKHGYHRRDEELADAEAVIGKV